MNDDGADLDFGAFLLGLIVGGAVGAAMGLLFAPQSGEETRMMIRDKSIELRERAEEMARDAKTKAEDMQRKGQVVLEEQKARLDAAVEAAKAPPSTKRA